VARDVTQFVPRRLFRAVLAQLATITESNGYQTQPLVTDDVRRADGQSGVQHTLFVAPTGLTPTETGSPTRWEGSVSIAIIGQTRPGKEDPTDLNLALLQDVLNVLTGQTAIVALCTAAGVGVTLAISNVEMDEPWMTLEDGLAGWTLTVTCCLFQTPPW
jgi:hypothetical protein